MEIKKTKIEDIDKVLELFNMAKLYFKENNIDQWQDDYPNKIDIIKDIKDGVSYVVVDKGIIATFVLSFDKDKNYDALVKGKWLNDNSYGVIHRIAIKDNLKGKGIGSFIFIKCKELCIENNIFDIRIDTHDANESMKKLILKNNFIYCGITTVEDGSLRNIYQLSF